MRRFNWKNRKIKDKILGRNQLSNGKMEQKANKTSVANALQRKANKLDVETAMCKNMKKQLIILKTKCIYG